MEMTHSIGNKSRKLLFVIMGVLIQRWLHVISSGIFLKNFIEEYTNEFQHFCSHITKFPIFASDKVEMFIPGFKDNSRNKVMVDLKRR